jgi:hypothetical protein
MTERFILYLATARKFEILLWVKTSMTNLDDTFGWHFTGRLQKWKGTIQTGIYIFPDISFVILHTSLL